MDSIAVVILAAGASTRMGQSKQMLTIHGQPMLSKTVQLATNSKIGEVIAILGSDFEGHKKLLEGFSVRCIFNPNWPKGIGSSIKVGVREVIEKLTKAHGILFLVCDQPHLNNDHLTGLIGRFYEDKTKIVASHYGGAIGVPAILPVKHFNELLNIEDHHGAKAVIDRHAGSIITVNFPGGEFDLDTKEDYDNFIKNLKS